MATIGPTLFAVLLWGAILAVACVFAYELSIVGRDVDWFDER